LRVMSIHWADAPSLIRPSDAAELGLGSTYQQDLKDRKNSPAKLL
jgi:hypothetical protein